MAGMEIFIDLDKELAYIREQLGGLHRRAPMVLRTAINKTAAEAKKRDDKITRQTYTAKRDINKLEQQKATTANLQAILRDRGKNISLSHFTHYVGKNRLTAVINTANGRKTIGKYGNFAFFNVLARGGNGIAVRYGKKRLPVEKISSISSPVMHGNKNTWGKIEPDMKALLRENVEKELERVLAK